MKNIVRALAIAMTLTGAAASAHIASASQTHNTTFVSRSSVMPIPTCPPDSPSACGNKLQ